MKRIVFIFLSFCCLSAIAQKEVKKVAILEKMNCSKNQIINIIGSNPEYLTKSKSPYFEAIYIIIAYHL